MTRTGQGFTLIELMVTVSVAAILLAVGVPNFSDMVKNNRMATTANELVGALNLARSEAIKRGVRVTVCKSADGATCTTSGNWEQGWIVFTDIDNNATYDNTTETLLRVYETVNGQVVLVGNTNVSDYVSFVPSGRSALTSGAFQAGNIKVCDGRTGNVGKKVILSSTGRLRIERNVACP